ncbi:hypothetical protein BT96DRAFT_668747 [Gymnopus androsaceus JB14]|uniref:Uncharacterized protein n=1 Tax=Gymnopus androsaceus JB14 TaxID=1447944 RepID=A0A6A4IDN5_9AGAR|nr:hypothetical protein BT96DRAFT_668747 [Gymnopus androsaceus JB14]
MVCSIQSLRSGTGTLVIFLLALLIVSSRFSLSSLKRVVNNQSSITSLSNWVSQIISSPMLTMLHSILSIVTAMFSDTSLNRRA